jgi:flavin reductase (DIM6/NTAB) family NADH-FMN oxidoreductase RutF
MQRAAGHRKFQGNLMDRTLLKHALGKIPYGLVVLGSKGEDGAAAMVATWITQVSFKPPLVAAAIETGSSMRANIEKLGHFSVNLLPAGGKGVAKDFLKSHTAAGHRIHGHEFVGAKNGSPFLAEAAAAIECRVIERFKTGDHLLFVGEVVDVVVNGEEDILTLKETGWKYQR